MKPSHIRAFTDWHSSHDRLNPKRSSPKQDRISDTWAMAWRVSIFIGLAVILINQVLNLLTGD